MLYITAKQAEPYLKQEDAVRTPVLTCPWGPSAEQDGLVLAVARA